MILYRLGFISENFRESLSGLVEGALGADLLVQRTGDMRGARSAYEGVGVGCDASKVF